MGEFLPDYFYFDFWNVAWVRLKAVGHCYTVALVYIIFYHEGFKQSDKFW